MPKLYYTTAEAAEILGFRKIKVYRLIYRGYVKAVRSGPRFIRIPAKVFTQFASDLKEFRNQYYSRKEAARRLRVTVTSIDNWIYGGHLSAYKFAFEPVGVLKEDCYTIDPGSCQPPEAA